MRKALLGAVGLLALGLSQAVAADVSLQGKWKISMPSNPRYNGIAMIDAQSRVTWDAMGATDKQVALRGYVKAIPAAFDLILTDGAAVVHIYCVTESSELMRCTNGDTKLRPVLSMILTRTDQAPANLARGTPRLTAENVIGVWRVPNSTLSAVLNIDADFRATLFATYLNAQNPGEMREIGAARVTFPRVDISFTQRTNQDIYALDHYLCTLLSTSEMDCANVNSAGVKSGRFVMTRLDGPP